MSRDQYVGKHHQQVQARYELLFLKEPVPETKKVTDFYASIFDPKLETATNLVWLGNERKLTNFELCQQHFKTMTKSLFLDI